MRRDIRHVMASCGDYAPLWRTDEQCTIGQLAALLVSGHIRVCGRQVETPLQRAGARSQPSGSAAGSSAAVPIRAAIPLAPGPVVAPMPVEEEQSVDLDIAAMVETLRTAARDGAPFCEECARARQNAA